MTPTSADLLQQWLQDLERKGRSVHTLAAYRRGLQHFIEWNKRVYDAEFDPAATIPRDVRDWKSYQQTVEKAAPATINQRLVALSRFFSWATSKGLAKDDPTVEVGSLRLPARQPKGLSDKDLRKLLRAAKAGGNLRDYAMIELLAGTGLRVGELLSLRVGDITLGERSGTVTVRQGKHGNFRTVPLTLDVRKALEAYLQNRSGDNDPEAALWTGIHGDLSHRSSVLRILDKYTQQAGIDAIGPHALRHTFATRYLNANPGDLRGLAALLGHSSLNTVMVYTEPNLGDLAERMERIEIEQKRSGHLD